MSFNALQTVRNYDLLSNARLINQLVGQHKGQKRRVYADQLIAAKVM
jgi:hypothetical protein